MPLKVKCKTGKSNILQSIIEARLPNISAKQNWIQQQYLLCFEENYLIWSRRREKSREVVLERSPGKVVLEKVVLESSPRK